MRPQYPRPEDWQVAYNVTPFELDPDGTDTDWRYFRSADYVPPWNQDEHDAIRARAVGIISSYLTTHHYPMVSETHIAPFGECSIGDPNGTRTLFINLVFDPGVIAVSWVLDLQREVVENWPFWRIRITYWEFGVEPSVSAPNDILIYPDRIMVGQRPQDVELRDAIDDWRRQFILMYRQTHAVECRRLKWLENETQKHVAHLSERPFAIVAVFRDVGKERDLICLLFRGTSTTWTISERRADDRDAVEEWAEYAVSKNGEIGERGLEWPDKIGLWVYGIPWGAAHDLDVCRIENAATDHIKYIPEFPFRVKESEIISDEFLADWERGQN